MAHHWPYPFDGERQEELRKLMAEAKEGVEPEVVKRKLTRALMDELHDCLPLLRRAATEEARKNSAPKIIQQRAQLERVENLLKRASTPT